jgi:hypothetical protein
MREEIINNNYVGKKEETHNIVGLRAISLGIDLKPFHAIRDNPFCGIEKPGRFGHVPSGVFEGIDDQFPFKVLHCRFKGKGRDGSGLFSGLKGGRQMMAVDYLIRAEKDSSLHTILEFSHIARPMVLHEHVNGRRRYPSDLLFMFLVEFFDEIVGQQEDVRPPLPKGRDENGEYVQTVIEILSERAVLDRSFQVLTGGSDDAYIHLKRSGPSDPFEFPFLKNPKKLCLGC